MSDAVLTERADGVLTVRINRPHAFNALDTEVLAGLQTAVSQAADDDTVRAVVVTGTGDKAFSAGADLKELSGIGPDAAHRAMEHGQHVLRSIEQTRVPVIAAVNGIALGGGFELVLAATFPVLSTTASLGLPESGLGLIPGYGGTQRLPRAVGARVATYLMLTGSRLDARRAYDLGLTPVPPVEPETLLKTATGIAARIAGQGPRAVRGIVRAVAAGQDAPLDTGLGVETALAALALAGEESTEGVNAFLERRPAAFTSPRGPH
ncbi:enoyl-CoA hydratase/isomerase family protein [Streptomyces sp. NPDC051677]|uniref:enoyl-CoA hydratase/isomerase family protein n=1 Tax=Streptomyces sp. NPDC051677 TaxID=3365669 RepID=UPI0037D0CFC8